MKKVSLAEIFPEERKLPEDELRAELMKTRKFTPDTKKHLRVAICDRISAELTSDEIVDLDVLYSTGGIDGQAELIQYVRLLEPCHRLRAMLDDLTLQLLSAINYPELVKRSFAQDGSVNPAGFNKRGIATPLIAFQELVNTLRVSGIFTFRNGRITEMEYKLCGWFAVRIYRAIESHFSQNIRARNLALNLLTTQIEKLVQRGPGMAACIIAQKQLESALTEPGAAQLHQLTVNTIPPVKNNPHQTLEYLRELTASRDVNAFQIDHGAFRFDYGPYNNEKLEPASATNSMVLSAVSISLGGRSLINFLVDRSSPRLYVNTSWLSLDATKVGRTLQDAIYPLIVQDLLKHFEGREIEELLAKDAEKHQAKLLAETREQILDVAIAPEEDASTYPAYVPFVSKPKGHEEIPKNDPSLGALSKEKVSLKGLTGNRVYSALNTLLRLDHITGSHHFFARKNGNGCYPISIHGSAPVGVGLLKKCLREYGISPEEFVSVV
jgi:predicted RNA binding protein YcfA (HicA-like mRNA interferase family)